MALFVTAEITMSVVAGAATDERGNR